LGQFSGQSDIDRVRDATDLVRLIGEHVTLKPRGREHVGLCPFHDDHSPSMAVVTHKGNAFYKCHACGTGGDAFDFVQNYHKMDFGEALRFLADRAGIPLTPRTPQGERVGDGEAGDADGHGLRRSSIREANAFAAAFFRKALKHPEAGAAGRDVIAERRISDEMAEQFMLGYAPDSWDKLLTSVSRKGLSEQAFLAAGLLKPRKTGEGCYDAFRHRLIFPIMNEVGQPIAFGARAIRPDDEPKYLNSAESSIFQKSRTLYGLHQAKRSIIDSRTAILTEGYTDVITCHQHGFTNVVGTLGTALTREHARLLSKFCDTVVLVFDGDEAGQRAADRGVEVFFSEPVDVRICVLPDNLDPDDLLRQDGGVEQFQNALDAATDALAFKVQRFQNAIQSVSGLSGRQKMLEQFLRELVDLGFGSLQGVRKRWVLTRLADMLGVTIDDLLMSMPRPRRSEPITPVPDGTASVPASGDELQPVTATDVDDLPRISPARWRAEHELLALLLFEPSLLTQLIPAMEQGEVPVTECFAVDQFCDPAAQAIARVIWNDLADRQSFVMQDVLARLEADEARTLATSLYFEGQRRCAGDSDAAVGLFIQAGQALLTILDREQHQRELMQRKQPGAGNDNADSLQRLQELIEFRRRHRHIAEAMPRGIR
jgi:DNA primase